MKNAEQKMCTTSGRPVDVVRAEQTESSGQHKDYIVLCEEERQKGFVRPFRDKYIHVGVDGHEIDPSVSAPQAPLVRPCFAGLIITK